MKIRKMIGRLQLRKFNIFFCKRYYAIYPIENSCSRPQALAATSDWWLGRKRSATQPLLSARERTPCEHDVKSIKTANAENENKENIEKDEKNWLKSIYFAILSVITLNLSLREGAEINENG